MIEMCEDISHINDYFFACEKCYQDREKHLGCEFCKNQEEFCIKCLKPVNKDKLKKEIIDKICITREQALDIKEKSFKSKEGYLKDVENVNKEFKERFKDLENTFGNILRDFELKEKMSTEEKNVLDKLWDYILKEIHKRFQMPMTHRERKKQLDLKYRKFKESLKKIRAKRNELKKEGGKFFSSQP